MQGRVGYAQDEQHRHVALKLVASDSSEIQILQLLFKKQKLFTGNIIPGLVPILDLLPFGGHWLVVMPRFVKFLTYGIIISDPASQLGS